MRKIEKIPISANGLTIYLIPALCNNVIAVIAINGSALVVDPGESHRVLECLKQNNLALKSILLTHAHRDHIGGVAQLKQETRCLVYGCQEQDFDLIDIFLDDEQIVSFGPLRIKALNTPGHAKGHVVYFVLRENILFSGDLLFNAGCGKIFEGTVAEMIGSLEKIKLLPDSTRIFCGHEYTMNNLAFVESLEPNQKEIKEYSNFAKKMLQKKSFAMPFDMKNQKKINPFLRVNEAGFGLKLGFSELKGATLFAKLREMKDCF